MFWCFWFYFPASSFREIVPRGEIFDEKRPNDTAWEFLEKEDDLKPAETAEKKMYIARMKIFLTAWIKKIKNLQVEMRGGVGKKMGRVYIVYIKALKTHKKKKLLYSACSTLVTTEQTGLGRL